MSNPIFKCQNCGHEHEVKIGLMAPVYSWRRLNVGDYVSRLIYLRECCVNGATRRFALVKKAGDTEEFVKINEVTPEMLEMAGDIK